jgi:hypothetical protein
MINADIALVRDLGIDGDLQPNGDVTCQFRGNNRCPLAAQTLQQAGLYRGDNGLWLNDFKAAFVKMLEKGL